MPSGRPGGYPYPEGFRSVADVENYLRTRLYPALISNDSRGEYFRDRRPPTDLTDLIVRPEWYGAKGDGATDDTTAIQAAIDAATAGKAVVFTPGKSYRTGQLWCGTSNVYIGCPSGKATLKANPYASDEYAIHVYGGTMNSPATQAYWTSTYSYLDWNATRISGVTIENLIIEPYTAATLTGTGICLEWADDCQIIGCEISYSILNAISARFCRRPTIRGNKLTNFYIYGTFNLMCSNALIEDNYIEGSARSADQTGINFKMNYNSEPCNHVARRNIVHNMYHGRGISGGYTYMPAYPDAAAGGCVWYKAGCEVVDGVTVEDNVLSCASDNTYNQYIAAYCYADNWIIRGNRWEGGGTTSAYGCLYLGHPGSYYTDAYLGLGTTGQDHIIDSNTFSNATLSTLAYVGCSCKFLNNVVGSSISRFVGEAAGTLSDELDILISGNVITAIGLAGAGLSGIFTSLSTTPAFRVAIITNNVWAGIPSVRSTLTFSEFVYSYADFTYVFGNNVVIGPSASSYQATSRGVVINGASSLVSGNYISVDCYGSGDKIAVRVGTDATDDQHIIRGNVFELPAAATVTGSVALQATQRTNIGENKYLGAWVAKISDTSGLGAILEYDERVFGLDTKSPSFRAETIAGVKAVLQAYGTFGGWIGTTSNHPLYIGANNTTQALFSAVGNLGLGGQTTFGTSATNTLAHKSGTAPGGNVADCYQQYSADIVGGNAAPHFRTEAGDVVKLYKQVLAADLEEAYETPELDTEAEVIAALNATNAKINDLIAAIQNTGLLASS